MTPRPDRKHRRRRPEAPKRRLNTPGFWVTLIVAVLLIGTVQAALATRPNPDGRRLDFSRFVEFAETGVIKNAVILDGDAYVEGYYQLPGRPRVKYNTPYIKAEGTRQALVDVVVNNEIPLKIDQQRIKAALPYLVILLPTLILITLLAYFIIAFRAGTGLFSARSGARKASGDDGTAASFDDVAGQDAAVTELRELTDFLIDPKRFAAVGARVPKGVLLYGPPGCGKTLLARAIAGESGASFYSISGSDFVEMYVGVGAARVRDLFKEARENTPAIVFIDEIDAVARKRRSGPAAAANEEQSQALNQLLTEMDGFTRGEGTIVIGATNRPDDLDAALLRPGRFDRTVSVDRPDEKGRAAILARHARDKPLAADVELPAIAARAIGFTGADLENVINEAALLAAREHATEISQRVLEEAVARILEAPERQRRLSMRDRTIGQGTLGVERTTFADVAGVGNVLGELQEITEYLRDPSRFHEVGARFPRGFLLVGPPGVGKTLLARAVAGEANAAFLSVAASEFTEVYVGEGSGRVRDLFGQARAMAPAIVFIDEIDAIGARRGHAADGHREREQTLNQILIELDGFRQRDGVIVMAATNRPELLDPALVRAGRFDREITIELPDRAGRRDILEVHVGSKRLAPDVDLDAIAAITRGLSGADLANVMNEAALLSARQRQPVISMAMLERAVERATLGIARPHVMSDEERRAVAVHEAGHVIVALDTDEGKLPHMVSIIPAGDTLGRAVLADTHDRVSRSRAQLIDEMAILLGGRAAEEIVFGEVTTTAAYDLSRVGRIANRMVRELGMSDAVGPIAYAGDSEEDGAAPMLSDDTARLIDLEARRLVGEAQDRAHHALTTGRVALDRLTEALLAAETLDAATIKQIVAAARTPV